MKYLSNLDLSKNELQNARIQNLAAAPANPAAGQIYFNTTDNKYYGYDGSSWVDLGYTYNGETFTTALLNKLNGIATGATKVEVSSTNGNIKIDGVEKTVYTHPGSGTNPHGTTQSDIGILTGTEASKPAATGSGKIYLATDTKKIWKDTASGTWTQMGGQDTIDWSNVTGKPSTFTPPIASATTLGGIKVGANLTIDANGVLNANDNPTSYIVKQEKFTASEGQTVFNLTKGSYRTGLGALSVFVYGSKLSSDAFTETSTTSFTLKTGLSAGDVVIAEYIQLIDVEPYPMHANEHLTGGTDPIPKATASNDGLMSKEDKAKLDNSYIKSEVDSLISAAVNNLINGAPGALDTLNELAQAMGDDPNFATTVTNALANKVDKVAGKQLSTEDYTTAEKNKLAGIQAGAQVNQNAVQSIQAVTSAGAAIGTATATTPTDTIQLKEGSNIDITVSGKTLVINNTYSYTHPANHPAAMITEDSTHRFVTDTDKSNWNAKPKKYAANIGDGTSTTITVTHNLGTMDVAVTLRETASPYNVVMTDIQIVDNNSIKLLFGAAPTSGQYRVVVIG